VGHKKAVIGLGAKLEERPMSDTTQSNPTIQLTGMSRRPKATDNIYHQPLFPEKASILIALALMHVNKNKQLPLTAHNKMHHNNSV
jgi:hypothetical protein